MTNEDNELLSILGDKALMKAAKPLMKADASNLDDGQQGAWQLERKWLATAHCLGASFNMLGKLHGRSGQSVLSRIAKELPTATRQSSRLRLSIKSTELVWYWDRFGEHKAVLTQMHPKDAAKWLLDNEPYTED